MEQTPRSAPDIQDILRKVFADSTLVYDRSRFAGGMTNYNYIMEIHGALYVIREPGPKTEQIIDRDAEERNNRIASDQGINSECVYFDKEAGVKISRFIEQARTFTEINPASSGALRAAAALLSRIHTSPVPFLNTFDWEAELTKYESIVQSMNCGFFLDYRERRRQLSAFVRAHAASLRSMPCHNDTVPENFLMHHKTKAAYLIDWEYSGMNDPAWDVAMYIAEAQLPEEAIREFLFYCYGTREIPPEEEMKLKCFVMAQELLWSVWALIRYYSGEDFLDYLYSRYNRFCRNLSELTRRTDYPLADMMWT